MYVISNNTIYYTTIIYLLHHILLPIICEADNPAACQLAFVYTYIYTVRHALARGRVL